MLLKMGTVNRTSRTSWTQSWIPNQERCWSRIFFCTDRFGFIRLYPFANKRCKTEQKSRLPMLTTCPFVRASRRFLSEWTKSRPVWCGISIFQDPRKFYHSYRDEYTSRSSDPDFVTRKKHLQKKAFFRYSVRIFQHSIYFPGTRYVINCPLHLEHLWMSRLYRIMSFSAMLLSRSFDRYFSHPIRLRHRVILSRLHLHERMP